MTKIRLDELIAFLEPQCGADKVAYVKRELSELFAIRTTLLSQEREAKRATDNIRTEQQSVEPYDEWLPNDPRNW
jgi:hypothetical protein|tara:strand:- start:601 stop:825 length:225 start_codon:yes stop_codon:yes gene_type:complete